MKIEMLGGTFYPTAARITQVMKMGVNPEDIIVVDQNQEEYGWLSGDFYPNSDSIKIVQFDSLCEYLNSHPEQDTGKYIYTRYGDKKLYSKYNQLKAIESIHSDVIYHTEPVKISNPEKLFIRLERDHGGKHANTLAGHVGCSNNDVIVVTEVAPSNFTNSVVFAGYLDHDGTITFDICISPSKFKKYNDFRVYTSMSIEHMLSIGYTPYIQDNLVKYNELENHPNHDKIIKAIHEVVKALGMTYGAFSCEMFSNDDLSQFFYIETNFRDDDIALSFSPSIWLYYKQELVEKGYDLIESKNGHN